MSLKETQNPEDESGEGREDDVGGERKKGEFNVNVRSQHIRKQNRLLNDMPILAS